MGKGKKLFLKILDKKVQLCNACSNEEIIEDNSRILCNEEHTCKSWLGVSYDVLIRSWVCAWMHDSLCIPIGLLSDSARRHKMQKLD